MNKKIIFFIAASVANFLYFLYLQYYIGVHVDAYDWNKEAVIYQKIALAGLFLSFCFAILLIFKGKESSKKIRLLCISISILIACLIVSSFLTIPDWGKYANQNTATTANDYRTEYQYEDVLEKHSVKNHYYLLYIGRASCPDCVKFESSLKSAVENENLFLAFYDTELDRKKDDFDQKMNMLKVKKIPAVRIIGNNQVIVPNDNIYSSKKALLEYLKDAEAEYTLPDNKL